MRRQSPLTAKFGMCPVHGEGSRLYRSFLRGTDEAAWLCVSCGDVQTVVENIRTVRVLAKRAAAISKCDEICYRRLHQVCACRCHGRCHGAGRCLGGHD